jgi:hypothetical protein
MLKVQAFDNEGNVFSTVDGLNFKWKIEDNPGVLRPVSQKEAKIQYNGNISDLKMKTCIFLLKKITLIDIKF